MLALCVLTNAAILTSVSRADVTSAAYNTTRTRDDTYNTARSRDDTYNTAMTRDDTYNIARRRDDTYNTKRTRDDTYNTKRTRYDNGTSHGNDTNSTTTDRHLYLYKSTNQVYPMVLFAIGVPANVLTIATIARMDVVTPATIMVAFLAAIDIAALTSKLTVIILGYSLKVLGQSVCELFPFTGFYFVMLSSWVVILICAERFVAICYPLHAGKMFTKRRSCIIICVLATAFAIFFILFRMTRDHVEYTTVQQTCETTSGNLLRWFYIVGMLSFGVPHISIPLLTIATVRGLGAATRTRRRRLMSGTTCRDDPDSPRCVVILRCVRKAERLERTMTFMMVAAAAINLALTFPMSFGYLVSYVYYSVESRFGYSPEYFWMAVFLMDTNHAINFFVYFCAVKKFRLALVRCFRCAGCPPAQLLSGQSQESDIFFMQVPIPIHD